MKKLTILLITFLIIYLIYNLFKDNKSNYVNITDINIIDNYINKDKLANYNSFISLSITDAINDISKNKTIEVNNDIYYLKKVLRESDIVVISVGIKELANNFDKYNMNNNYDYFNNMYSNIEKLIKEIKKYAYGKIIMLGYYNPTNYYDANIDQFFYDIDIKLNRLMMDNNVIYIDLYELIKENNYKEKNSFYLNKDGIKKIDKLIEFYVY